MLRPAAALLAVLLLAGCVPGDPVVTPAPEPDATPVFASDEEALAAATEAYGKYLEVSDEILADGGKEPERISKFVTSDQLQRELAGFREWSGPGDHGSGSTTFDTVALQQYSDRDGEAATVTIYLCIDLSDLRILNEDGDDITPESRVNRYPLEVDFVGDRAETLLISRSEPWSGSNFC